MSYRTSAARRRTSRRGSPRARCPRTRPGSCGFTYPNPVHLAREATTYLFWRGGNFNPTFSTQADGADAGRRPRTLVSVPGERPYVKVDSNGESTRSTSRFTNAHPNEARRRQHLLRRLPRRAAVPGRRDARSGRSARRSRRRRPTRSTTPPRKAWIHDVAHRRRRAARCSSSPPSPPRADHRYMYARWTGSAWVRRTRSPPPAARSATTARSPTTAAASRSTTRTRAPSTCRGRSDGVYEVETWTHAGRRRDVDAAAPVTARLDTSRTSGRSRRAA